jgi:hypothetical protein
MVELLLNSSRITQNPEDINNNLHIDVIYEISKFLFLDFLND